MKGQLPKILFSYVFLFILFAKMMISALPLITNHFDSKGMNAVIMQLEIENNTSKDCGKQFSESLNKSEWLDKLNYFNFALSYHDLDAKSYTLINDEAVQHFYPSVPTPPPSV